jgi:hypothetical protein
MGYYLVLKRKELSRHERHGGIKCMFLSYEVNLKCCIFWIKQNYRDNKKVSACQRLSRGRDEDM